MRHLTLLLLLITPNAFSDDCVYIGQFDYYPNSFIISKSRDNKVVAIVSDGWAEEVYEFATKEVPFLTIKNKRDLYYQDIYLGKAATFWRDQKIKDNRLLFSVEAVDRKGCWKVRKNSKRCRVWDVYLQFTE